MFEDISQWLPILIALLVAGSCAGILAGLLGVGGGIVMVPVLYFLFQYFGVSPSSAMVVATGTSLAAIIPTSISSIRSHHRRGNVDWSLIKRWLLFVIGGVLVGGWLVTIIDGQYFTILFALIALFVAFNMLFRSEKTAFRDQLPPMPQQGFFGTLIGFLSVMVGIGGGTLGVTILTTFNYAMHRAVGTSAVFGLLISVPGALVLLSLGQTPSDAPVATIGYVNWMALLALVPMSVSFAPVGAWLGSRLDSNKLKKVFAIVLSVTAIRMLLQSFL